MLTDNINKRYAAKPESENEKIGTQGSNFKFDQKEAENKLRDAGQSAREIFQDVRKSVTENYSRTENAIKNYPFLSAAGAFVAGITIAKLFGRRD